MKHAAALPLLAFTVAAPCGFLLTAGLRSAGDGKRDPPSASAAPLPVAGQGAPGDSSTIATATTAAAVVPRPSPPVLRTAADVVRLFDGGIT